MFREPIWTIVGILAGIALIIYIVAHVSFK